MLQNLPRSLSETYDRLLGKIEGADRQNMIEKMFKWIVVTRQPLCVDELREGIAFELEDEEWDPEKVPTDFNRLVRACGNLVVIDKETQVVQLGMHALYSSGKSIYLSKCSTLYSPAISLTTGKKSFSLYGARR